MWCALLIVCLLCVAAICRLLLFVVFLAWLFVVACCRVLFNQHGLLLACFCCLLRVSCLSFDVCCSVFVIRCL